LFINHYSIHFFPEIDPEPTKYPYRVRITRRENEPYGFMISAETKLVSRVISASPAERSGLKVGDRVQSIEYVDISSWEVQHSHIVGLLKDAGDTVNLTIGGKDTKY
jgi:S1-C subfamily serine protease